MPMPASATARIRLNVKTVPPSSGVSMRAHTSSIRKKTNPTTPAESRTNTAGAAFTSLGDDCGRGDLVRRRQRAIDMPRDHRDEQIDGGRQRDTLDADLAGLHAT